MPTRKLVMLLRMTASLMALLAPSLATHNPNGVLIGKEQGVKRRQRGVGIAQIGSQAHISHDGLAHVRS